MHKEKWSFFTNRRENNDLEITQNIFTVKPGPNRRENNGFVAVHGILMRPNWRENNYKTTVKITIPRHARCVFFPGAIIMIAMVESGRWERVEDVRER